MKIIRNNTELVNEMFVAIEIDGVKTCLLKILTKTSATSLHPKEFFFKSKGPYSFEADISANHIHEMLAVSVPSRY